MRILSITNLYPRPGHDLIAPFNRQQFGALAQAHAVRVIAPVPWHQALKDQWQRRPAPGRYTNSDGVEVEHPLFYYPPRMMRPRAGHFFYHSIRKCVQQALAQFQPDVLLACWAHPDGWAALRLARQAGLPVVIKVVGSDVLVATRDMRRRMYIGEALSCADRVVAVSRDLAAHVERLGVDRRRIDVVLGGIDRDIFSPGEQQDARRRLGLPPEQRIILFVGNVLLSKGTGVLVEACRILRDRGIVCRERTPWRSAGPEASAGRNTNEGGTARSPFPTECYVVGGGSDEGKVRSLIAKYGLGDCVKLVGPRGHAELPDWYRACDVVTLPSFSEGIPNVLYEALACARPFVATRVGGIPEIADPSYSRLVEPGNAPALAAALAEVLAAPPRVHTELVQRCIRTWRESAEQLAEVLAAACEAGGRGSEVGGQGGCVAPALVAGSIAPALVAGNGN